MSPIACRVLAAARLSGSNRATNAQQRAHLRALGRRLYRYNTSLLPVVSRDPFLLAALTSGFMNSTLLLTFSTIIQINLTHIRMI